jgi:hypothetical protein
MLWLRSCIFGMAFLNAETGQSLETTVEDFMDIMTILESKMRESGRRAGLQMTNLISRYG